MGTRADFYVGKGKDAQWLGSIAWDGYRDGIDASVLAARTEQEYRDAVEKFFGGRDDVTRPDQGWPWPWETSATSDCSYWFFDGQVYDVHSKYGACGARYTPCDRDVSDEDDAWLATLEPVDFPDMSERMNVTWGPRSGLLIMGVK